jgi:hypothetical protein
MTIDNFKRYEALDSADSRTLSFNSLDWVPIDWIETVLSSWESVP